MSYCIYLGILDDVDFLKSSAKNVVLVELVRQSFLRKQMLHPRILQST